VIVSIFVVVGIFRGYFDLSFYLCAFASSADVAKGGEGAKSALRETLNSLVVARRKPSPGRHIKIQLFLSANSRCRVRRKLRTFSMFSDDQ
jgi:hypothetical protein